MVTPAGSVGFIGLGMMGSAMSAHLLEAGFEVTGFDLDQARRAEHAARGGRLAGGPAEVGSAAGVVVTSLPSATALAEVTEGDRGLAARAGPGLTVLETSTLPLEAKLRARDSLAARGAWLLDCPLSGTGEQARHRDLVAYLSGDDAAKAGVREVLAAFTRDIYDAGEFGNGTRLKLVANLLVAVHNVAAAEALVLAERAGLDLDLVLRAVGDGAGTSRMFEVRGPRMAAADYAGPGMRASVFDKDLGIIAAFARELGSPAPLFTLASVFYRAALAQGRGDQDTACVHGVLRQLAGG